MTGVKRLSTIMIGMYRDEFANFLIKNRRIISKDSVMLRVGLPMLPNSWGEDFVPILQFPKSFCVMVAKGSDFNCIKPYSPIHWTSEYIDLLIKTYPEGRVSNSLFNKEIGDKIWMRGPIEKLNVGKVFGQGNQVKRLLAFAGGTGIAPIYQIIKYLEDAANTKIILTYSNKTREDILLLEELEQLQLYMGDRLEIRHFITSERGYLTLDDVDDCDKGDFVLVCGPKGFNELLNGENGLLLQKNFKKEQIYKY